MSSCIQEKLPCHSGSSDKCCAGMGCVANSLLTPGSPGTCKKLPLECNMCNGKWDGEWDPTNKDKVPCMWWSPGSGELNCTINEGNYNTCTNTFGGKVCPQSYCKQYNPQSVCHPPSPPCPSCPASHLTPTSFVLPKSKLSSLDLGLIIGGCVLFLLLVIFMIYCFMDSPKVKKGKGKKGKGKK